MNHWLSSDGRGGIADLRSESPGWAETPVQAESGAKRNRDTVATLRAAEEGARPPWRKRYERPEGIGFLLGQRVMHRSAVILEIAPEVFDPRFHAGSLRNPSGAPPEVIASRSIGRPRASLRLEAGASPASGGAPARTEPRHARRAERRSPP